MILGSLLVLSNHRGQVGPAFQAKPDPKFILFWAVRKHTQASKTSHVHLDPPLLLYQPEAGGTEPLNTEIPERADK